MLTRRFVVVTVAVVALAALLPVSSVWLPMALVVVALAALAAVDWSLADALEQVEIQRIHPSSIELSRASEMTWSAQNRSAKRVRFELADQLRPSLGVATRRVSFAIEPGETARRTVAMTPTRRGRFPLAEYRLRVPGPLGLAARQRLRSAPSELRVVPLFKSRKVAELALRRARSSQTGIRRTRHKHGGSEFEQLREMTPDDEFRRIDWAATARSGTAIIRTYRAEQNQTVIAMLDSGRVMAGQVDGVPRLEHAMDALLALGTVAVGMGDRVGLIPFGQTPEVGVAPARGAAQIRKFTDAIYAIQPSLIESDYAAAIAHTLSRQRRRAMLALFTSLDSAAVSEWLLPTLPMLCRRHLVVLVAVQDPDIVALAEAPAELAADAYARASAIATLDQRRELIAALGAVGARVIDAPPDRVALEIAEFYLASKELGSL